MISRPAVQGHRQNPRNGRLTYPPVAAENVPVRRTLLLNSIFQSASYVLLPDYVGEFLRPVLARQNLIAHAKKYRLYVMRRDTAPRQTPVGCGLLHLRTWGTRGRLLAVQNNPVAKEALVQLELSTRSVEGVAVVDCHGRMIFGEESASLRDTIKNLLATSNQIVLNLGGVNYIDSGGLGTLVALYTTARNAGGSIKLAALTQRVGDLLQVTKLLTVFDVFDTVEQAVGSFIWEHELPARQLAYKSGVVGAR
jgi:anti-sigma B factor antagonist